MANLVTPRQTPTVTVTVPVPTPQPTGSVGVGQSPARSPASAAPRQGTTPTGPYRKRKQTKTPHTFILPHSTD